MPAEASEAHISVRDLTMAYGSFVLAEPDLFLNTSSDARLLAETLDVAAGPRRAPDPAELAADREAERITPLFDGAELERI